MTHHPAAGAHPAASIQRRVAVATVIGTTVEWYDFFIYATAAGLVFADLFFKPAGARIGLLMAFASVGVSFLLPAGAFRRTFPRPVTGASGAHAAAHGCATTLIGVLPTYATGGHSGAGPAAVAAHPAGHPPAANGAGPC
jgi:hypothetical protein